MRNYEKETISWEVIQVYLRTLYQHIQTQPRKNFTGVYGIPRGGLVLAVMISHIFGIPLLQAPCQGCIIVDDLADSGRTLEPYVTDDYNKKDHFITTVYRKERSTVEPDFYLSTREDDTWVVFPWEILEE